MPFAGDGPAAVGLAAAVEVLGLNRSPRLNFGVAEGLAAAAASPFLRARFPLGEAAGEAAGLAAVAASACLRARFALGETAGEPAAEGDSAVSAPVGSCAGDSLGVGD